MSSAILDWCMKMKRAPLATLTSHRTIIDAIDLVRAWGSFQHGRATACWLSLPVSLTPSIVRLPFNRRITVHMRIPRPRSESELGVRINIGDLMVKDRGIFVDRVNVAARLAAPWLNQAGFASAAASRLT